MPGCTGYDRSPRKCNATLIVKSKAGTFSLDITYLWLPNETPYHNILISHIDKYDVRVNVSGGKTKNLVFYRKGTNT